MNLFQQVENATIVMTRNGLYFESPLFAIGKALYGKDGRYYARLIQNGHTSSANIRWTQIAGVEWVETAYGVFAK